MTFFKCLYTLVLMPLQLLFEVIYNIANDKFIDNPGLSIIALSIAVNFLVLPLYRMADKMQEEQRQTEARLQKGVSHIRKTFSGDERTMMLQTYYRQNGYSPVSALRGATSLFLEIPFFIAAYRFLSGLELLSGIPLGPIKDLSQPDSLIVLGNTAINLLPVLMTAINVVSSAIFSKDYPLKTKIQLYVMAAFFLVFLYDSPSGLVFYWTLNNAFSLVKTVFYKLKNPGKVLTVLAFAAGIGIIAFIVPKYSSISVKKTIVFLIFGIVLCIPLVLYIFRKKFTIHLPSVTCSPDKRIFIWSAVFLALLTGFLIPSAVIKSSPQEFVNLNDFIHPHWFIVSSLLTALGTFILWFGVFYWLASPQAKVIFERLMWIACGVAVADYLFFGTDLGILSSDLKYTDGLYLPNQEQLVNLLIVAVIALLFYLLIWKKSSIVKRIISVATLSILCMSIINTIGIEKSVANINLSEASDETPSFSLSKTGKNVIVLMLDRGIGEYIPYFFNERPELKAQFDGFTYYPNTVSFGAFTNFATPALYGGYEYTPLEINLRDSESLVSKQNEALKVMPVIFDEAGYDVTVCDPSYADYQWIPNLSIYDDYPDIKTFITNGYFSEYESITNPSENMMRNFFCFGCVKSVPLVIQGLLYDSGKYNMTSRYGGQIVESMSTAGGIDGAFMDSFTVLENLTNMTKISDSANGTFLMMSNESTHEPIMLQEPDYLPSKTVDNTEYDESHKDRFSLNGEKILMESEGQIISYQTNMATIIQIGQWLDYLRDNKVYDNTKIIIVSDHGRNLYHHSGFTIDDFNLEFFTPLLLVKDYNSTGFSTSQEFMTNADTATIAFDGSVVNPINPFTDKEINSSVSKKDGVYVFADHTFSTEINNGNQFLPGDWFTVHDNVWDISNWTKVADNAVLPY